MTTYAEMNVIAELSGGIILSKHIQNRRLREGYQTEAELETQLLIDLERQGYERVFIRTSAELYANLKRQIERLNGVVFTDDEWVRFLSEYLDAYNISERVKKSGKSYVECMNEYYGELNSGQTNRANEFVNNQGGIDNIKAKLESAQESQQVVQDFFGHSNTVKMNCKNIQYFQIRGLNYEAISKNHNSHSSFPYYLCECYINT